MPVRYNAVNDAVEATRGDRQGHEMRPQVEVASEIIRQCVGGLLLYVLSPGVRPLPGLQGWVGLVHNGRGETQVLDLYILYLTRPSCPSRRPRWLFDLFSLGFSSEVKAIDLA